MVGSRRVLNLQLGHWSRFQRHSSPSGFQCYTPLHFPPYLRRRPAYVGRGFGPFTRATRGLPHVHGQPGTLCLDPGVARDWETRGVKLFSITPLVAPLPCFSSHDIQGLTPRVIDAHLEFRPPSFFTLDLKCRCHGKLWIPRETFRSPGVENYGRNHCDARLELTSISTVRPDGHYAKRGPRLKPVLGRGEYLHIHMIRGSY